LPDIVAKGKAVAAKKAEKAGADGIEPGTGESDGDAHLPGDKILVISPNLDPCRRVAVRGAEVMKTRAQGTTASRVSQMTRWM
jgi:hypothetical protein